MCASVRRKQICLFSLHGLPPTAAPHSVIIVHRLSTVLLSAAVKHLYGTASQLFRLCSHSRDCSWVCSTNTHSCLLLAVMWLLQAVATLMQLHIQLIFTAWQCDKERVTVLSQHKLPKPTFIQFNQSSVPAWMGGQVDGWEGGWWMDRWMGGWMLGAAVFG